MKIYLYPIESLNLEWAHKGTKQDTEIEVTSEELARLTELDRLFQERSDMLDGLYKRRLATPIADIP